MKIVAANRMLRIQDEGETVGASGEDWETHNNITNTIAIGRCSATFSPRTLPTQGRGTDLARLKVAPVSRSGISSPPLSRTRYARTSNPSTWLHASRGGFVGAILDAAGDGRDRVVFAWPSQPDNGFVAAAIALREARVTGRFAHATLALWPWRSGTTFAARSILVHPKDIALAAGKAVTELHTNASWADRRLAHEALCMVELRLNDLVPRDGIGANPGRDESPRGTTSDTRSAHNALVVTSPTLLETTMTFAPSKDPVSPSYTPDAEQTLNRVRHHTRMDDDGSTMSTFVAAIGDPGVTPFAIMGLEPADQSQIARRLAYRRFATHGLDVVVVDLVRTAQTALMPDWESQLCALLAALDTAYLPRRPPVVILCEDTFAWRRANVALRKHNKKAQTRRPFPLQQGALLLHHGILEEAGPVAPPQDLPPLLFDVDVKDASLVPLRDRLVGLARRLREAGRGNEAASVWGGLRFLSACATLPVGVNEAKRIASILFDGDGPEETKARSAFYPTSMLAPMAEAERTAPELARDIRELRDAINLRIDRWSVATPVSLKLAQLLSYSEWSARDVLLVLPDTRIANVFHASDRGVCCTCTVIESSQLAARTTDSTWRRILIVRPEPKVVRALLTMRTSPEHVLLLGDSAGIPLVAAELGTLVSLQEFAPFAPRARALLSALNRGGASETITLDELEYRYHVPAGEDLIDLTQASDGYAGEVVRLGLEGGAEVVYRPGSDVLVFTPMEVRRFRKTAAREVRLGDRVLVLRKDLRDKLSEALLRSRKAAQQLKMYHERVVRFRGTLCGSTVTQKARHALTTMRKIDPSVGNHEVSNIARWLSVEPSDRPQQPRAARGYQRFSIFMQAAGVDKAVADAFWNFAIIPARVYSAQEGHFFNQRVVQFVLDPESVSAVVSGRTCDDDLWQVILNSVDVVIYKETSSG